MQASASTWHGLMCKYLYPHLRGCLHRQPLRVSTPPWLPPSPALQHKLAIPTSTLCGRAAIMSCDSSSNCACAKNGRWRDQAHFSPFTAHSARRHRAPRRGAARSSSPQQRRRARHVWRANRAHDVWHMAILWRTYRDTRTQYHPILYMAMVSTTATHIARKTHFAHSTQSTGFS